MYKRQPEYHTLLGFCTIVLKEVSVGLLVGLGAQLCTSIVLFAGRIIDMEVGLSMANVFDPTTNQQSSIRCFVAVWRYVDTVHDRTSQISAQSFDGNIYFDSSEWNKYEYR